MKYTLTEIRATTMKTADLVDDFYNDVSFCDVNFRAFGQKSAFYGPIQTVKCFEDNGLLKAELQKPGKGRVLVVDGGGSTRIAILGDMIATSMHKNGWAGIIIHGVIRDSVEINAMDVGVKALGTCPVKSIKRNEGLVGAPISFGGVTFTPDHWVYADEDGVLLAPQELKSKNA